MGSMNGGSSTSQRMNGLVVGAEILVLLLLCSLPYSRGNPKVVKQMLFAKRDLHKDELGTVEYASWGGDAPILTFTNPTSADVVIKELELVTKATLDTVPDNVIQSLCFEKHRGNTWIAAMDRAHKDDACVELMGLVGKVVEQLIKDVKLQHFVLIQHKSESCNLVLGVVSATPMMNSETMKSWSSFRKAILELSENKEEHVYKLEISRSKGE